MEYRSARGTVIVVADKVIERARHGTNVGYQRDGCRCPECTRAHREYMKAWRRAKE